VPPGADWGFNYEGDRAWIMAETDVDAERLVAQAIAAADGD
jgi:hypothetical protein